MSRFSNLPNAKCWRCYREVNSKASILCSDCHKREMAKVHARDTPTAKELGLLGQQGDYAPWIVNGLRTEGRRVIRKSEPLAG